MYSILWFSVFIKEKVFETSVQTKVFVSHALVDNEFSFAKNLLRERAFDTKFDNRKHDRIQERERIKSRQFLRFLKP